MYVCMYRDRERYGDVEVCRCGERETLRYRYPYITQISRPTMFSATSAWSWNRDFMQLSHAFWRDQFWDVPSVDSKQPEMQRGMDQNWQESLPEGGALVLNPDVCIYRLYMVALSCYSISCDVCSCCIMWSIPILDKSSPLAELHRTLPFPNRRCHLCQTS